MDGHVERRAFKAGGPKSVECQYYGLAWGAAIVRRTDRHALFSEALPLDMGLDFLGSVFLGATLADALRVFIFQILDLCGGSGCKFFNHAR